MPCKTCNYFEPHVDDMSPDEIAKLNLPKIPDNCSRFLCNNGTCPDDKEYGRYSDCKQCPPEFKVPCENEFGKETGHGDDCTSVIGTHFCRASWAQYKCNCKNKEKLC